MPTNVCKVRGSTFNARSWNTSTCDDCLNAGFKYCTSCGEAKDIAAFHFRRGKPYICKKCHYKKSTASRKNTNYQEKLNERYHTDDEYRKKQIEASIVSFNKRLENDAEYREARNKASRDRKRELRATNEEYRLADNKRRLDNYKKRYVEDAEYRERCKLRTYNKARAVRGSLTIQEWLEACERFNYKCAYCGADAMLTKDHVIPITKGGKTSADNVIPACTSCNSSKSNRDMIEWFTSRPFYKKERLEAIIKYLQSRKGDDA